MEGTRGIPVAIHMETTIRDGVHKESNELSATGLLFKRGVTTFVRFEEPVEDDGRATMQTLKIQENEMSVSRKGALTMNQRFIPGTVTEGMFHSPYGQMAMRTDTKDMDFQWNELLKVGTLRLRYSLHLQGSIAGDYDMHVTIREVSG
ncbi:uncharacterized beta-barrel protein YwiB (DUF1934 family) [Evansella vedderi]|uniref:Uncharacterized beta-barrel protein YwiB (DUF1934 family) n=1 Tax=Evansella vedderi TaxID=38282 RepID=A0ABU0A4X9_9BACI|nr:DUF1934 domain-containing protein [Evansella vedderi]MDQ0257395.1 uncharacterized beta-barrel protein YwiB (DUF1934 family) [Evansella vedderi]